MKTLAEIVLDVTGIAAAVYVVYPLFQEFNTAITIVIAALQTFR